MTLKLFGLNIIGTYGQCSFGKDSFNEAFPKTQKF